MAVMCSVVKNSNMVVFDLGMARNGDPVYKISWYNGKRWMSARYRNFDDAYQTWKLVSQMV